LHVGVPGLQIVHTLNILRALYRSHVNELSRRSNLMTIDYVGEGAGTNTWEMYKLWIRKCGN